MKPQSVRSRSWIDLGARLWLAMLFVLLPAVGYIVTASVLELGRARAQGQADLAMLVKLAAGGQQQSLDQARRTLALVAMLAPVQSAVQGGDPAACGARLAEVAAKYPQSTGFGVWELNGSLLCADRPGTAASSAVGERWFRQALAQRAFSIGDFRLDDPNSQPTVAFGYPITGSKGQLMGVVSTGLDLGHLIEPAGALPLPADAVAVVIDHGGTILARSAEPANWMGKALPDAPSLVSDLSAGQEVLERADVDGVSRWYAFAPVPGPGGDLVYLGIGRPAQAVSGPPDIALVVSLSITAGLTVLALALAGWWGRQMLVRPMRSLVNAAERIAGGDWAARADAEAASTEIDRVAAALNTMAGSLEQGEAARREAVAAAERAGQQAQQSQARAAQLEAVSAGLSAALTPAEVMDAILRQGAGAVGATAATLLLLTEDGAWLKQAASVGYSDQISRLFQRYPVSSPLPAADAVRTGEAVWIESAAAFRARYPQLTEVINATDYEAAAALPLRHDGRVTGALLLSFPRMLAFTNEIQTYFITLAALCALAMERARRPAESPK